MMFHLATPWLLFFVLDNQWVEADIECVIANHQIVCQPQPSTAKGVRKKRKERDPRGGSREKEFYNFTRGISTCVTAPINKGQDRE